MFAECGICTKKFTEEEYYALTAGCRNCYKEDETQFVEDEVRKDVQERLR